MRRTLYVIILYYSYMAALHVRFSPLHDLMLRSRNGISIGRTYSDFNFVSRHVVVDLCRCCFWICIYTRTSSTLRGVKLRIVNCDYTHSSHCIGMILMKMDWTEWVSRCQCVCRLYFIQIRKLDFWNSK